MANRVVITGLGMVTPAGVGKESFFQSLASGRSTIVRPSLSLPEDGMDVAAEIRDFNIEDFVSRKFARFMDRASSFCYVASRLALEDARINMEKVNTDNVAVSVGTFLGSVNWGEPEYNRFYENPGADVHRFAAIIGYFGSLIGNVTIPLGIHGRSQVFLNSDVASCDAIGYGYECIQRGKTSISLAGGTEAPLTPGIFYLFNSVEMLAKDPEFPARATRPFDLHRNGFALGEGAWMLVLEDLDHALERDAPIYAEIIGYSTSCHGNIAGAMENVLRRANVRPEAVEYISANGLATVAWDPRETRAIKRVFGDAAKKVPVSSIKSMFGHPLGAAGSMQAASCAWVLQEGVIPPTINLDTPDPECDLDFVPNAPRRQAVDVVLQNTIGLTGKNSALLYRRLPE
jgi:3-oxoacyl-[acyl-carrier-protein] synthase II